MILFINILLYAALIYVIMGLSFSLYFYLRGARQLDPGTVDTPWHFKAIIFPGVVLFWLLLLVKLIRKP